MNVLITAIISLELAKSFLSGVNVFFQTCIYLRVVAEQLHCSLHVKELKVTTTELERQA